MFAEELVEVIVLDPDVTPVVRVDDKVTVVDVGVTLVDVVVALVKGGVYTASLND
jgi:hypothetical protein